jgi:hypothetical protein
VSVALTNGLGESVGDTLASAAPLQLSGNVWFVSSLTGTDASGTAGQNKEKPLATLAQAVTNASSGDMICLLTGHTETRTSAIAISKSLRIVGIGTTSGKPSVQLKNNQAAAALLTLSGSVSVEFRNIYFPTQTQACSATLITAGSLHQNFIGCYFEGDDNVNDSIINLNTSTTGSRFSMVNCTMVSTSTTITTQPVTGVKATLFPSAVWLDGCVFDDGTVGWSGDYVWDTSSSAFGIEFFAQNLSLLRGAAIKLNSSLATVNVQTVSGGARVVL